MNVLPDDFDCETFLRDYWQKQPLLIRGSGASWHNPLDPDDLAGLACEHGVAARLVTRTKKTWKLRHGPFKASRFARLGRKPWTLLVQAVDHVIPAVATLLGSFRFIPNWRIDDVMVSYATDGGGVGPHFDQFDVFLVQGMGQRRWQIGGRCDVTTALLPHDDLRLLARFEATDEWVLGPGDVLYIPPGFAHDGVAVGDDCMTYSIGFRAPSRAELISNWCDHLLETLPDDDRFADADLRLQPNPGEITSDTITRLHAMVTTALHDREAFAGWFGTFTTQPTTGDLARGTSTKLSAVRAAIARGTPLQRTPASRFSFIREPENVILFVDGQTFVCCEDTSATAELLCANERPVVDRDAADAVLTLITALIDQGSLALDD